MRAWTSALLGRSPTGADDVSPTPTPERPPATAGVVTGRRAVRPAVPPWSTPGQACVLIVRGTTFATAVRVAAVVGTILTVVNQGGVLVSGDATLLTWCRVAVNYAVPFVVSSIGYLAPFRVRARG